MLKLLQAMIGGLATKPPGFQGITEWMGSMVNGEIVRSGREVGSYCELGKNGIHVFGLGSKKLGKYIV